MMMRPFITQTENIWNSRTATVTADVLRDYKDMITQTTSDLEEHLQEIESKLEALPLRRDTISDEDAAERERIQEEMDSTKQCLAICAQVSEQVNQFRPNFFEDISAAEDSQQVDVATLGKRISAKRVTANVLHQFEEKLTKTTSDLEEHLHNIDNRLQTLLSPGARTLGEVERKRVQEEMDSIKQCLAICEQASEQAEKFRTNVFEDVSAARDAHQLVVATLGDLISAKRVTAGRSATQWLGQMSDASLQQLSRDRGIEARIRPSTDKVPELQGELGARFADHYGELS
jgi:chromosome segregation ATPase